MDSSIAYLSSCYSHPDPVVREERYLENLHAAAYLMSHGEIVFSPITHSHVIASAHDLPESWDFWKRQDFAFLHKCSKLYVLPLEGWAQSVGVREEMELARELGLEIVLMVRDEEEYEIRTYLEGRR